MSGKTAQLQIRLTPEQKARLKALARQAGQSVTDYVLAKALPEQETRIQALVEKVGHDAERRYALAAIHDWLARSGGESGERIDVTGLPALWQNYLAAMFEHAAAQKGRRAPSWTKRVAPLEDPYFATELKRLRPYLLTASPVPYRRRNIFVDSGVGARV